MDTLKTGGHYKAYSEPKTVRDENPEKAFRSTDLWVISESINSHYTILVQLPNGKFDIRRRTITQMVLRLGNGQIELIDEGHFPNLK